MATYQKKFKLCSKQIYWSAFYIHCSLTVSVAKTASEFSTQMYIDAGNKKPQHARSKYLPQKQIVCLSLLFYYPTTLETTITFS